MTPGQRTRLADATDYLAVAPRVVRVAPDAPVGDVQDTLPRTPADPDELAGLSTRWGLTSSVSRILTALSLD